MPNPPPPERRGNDRRPVRLKVVFRTAHSLLTEYTTSVSKGGCRIETHRPLEVGTRFIFEMFRRNSRAPVEIEGRVTRCEPAAGGLYELGIQYTPSEDKRAALEGVLDEIFAEHQFEKTRQHVRMPVNLIATDVIDARLKYLIRDLSLGGMGLRLAAATQLPPHIQSGALACLAVLSPTAAPIEIGGEVVWTVAGVGGLTHPAIGVSFLGVRAPQRKTIEALSRLERAVDLTLTFSPRQPGAKKPR